MTLSDAQPILNGVALEEWASEVIRLDSEQIELRYTSSGLVSARSFPNSSGVSTNLHNDGGRHIGGRSRPTPRWRRVRPQQQTLSNAHR